MAFAVHNSVTSHAITGFVPLSGFVMPLEFYGRVATPSCRRDYGWKKLIDFKIKEISALQVVFPLHHQVDGNSNILQCTSLH